MKKLLFLFLLITLGCKTENKEVDISDIPVFADEVATRSYSESLAGVLEAHGGMDAWEGMNNLCFEIGKSSGVETHTVSLKDRKSKIEAPKWAVGYDGESVWLDEKEEGVYEGDARFYHNLYFYFYAMPFVLADEGINYEDVEPTELDGKVYNGVKITYDDGVGDSPKDEYVMYYDPETKVMSWLAYTVTFNSNEKSDNWKYIKYSKWNPVNGLTLPKSLTWYNVEEGKPTDQKSEMVFDKITITETVLDDELFAMPTEAVKVEREEVNR